MPKTIIYEPMTTITDVLIAIIALYYSRELTAIYLHQLLNVQYHLIWTFRMLSFGALLGAISHGIGPYFHPIVGDLVWKFTTYSIGIMSYFMVLTMLHHLFDYPVVLRLRWILIALIIIYLAVVTINDNFINVIRFYVPLMVMVVLGLLYAWLTGNADGTSMIILGILISFIAAGVQQSGIVLHEHMNYNDIAHFIQMVAMWCFYRGSLVLKDSVL
jgi:hypothetical protein